jgi:hypothetical protein
MHSSLAADAHNASASGERDNGWLAERPAARRHRGRVVLSRELTSRIGLGYRCLQRTGGGMMCQAARIVLALARPWAEWRAWPLV